MSLDSTERLNLTLSAAAVVASAAFASPQFAVSVALGSVLWAANYRALRHSAERFFSGAPPGSWAWTAGFGLRFGVVALALAAAVWAGAHPVGLVLGLSMIVPAVVIAALRAPRPGLSARAAPPPGDPSWDRWDPWLARERDEIDGDEW